MPKMQSAKVAYAKIWTSGKYGSRSRLSSETLVSQLANNILALTKEHTMIMSPNQPPACPRWSCAVHWY